MDRFGHLVQVYIGVEGSPGNVALLTGVLSAGIDMGRAGDLVQAGDGESHEDFRHGTTFFWVKDRHLFNGFHLTPETFLLAELDDDDPPAMYVARTDGVGIIVEPVAQDSPARRIYD